MERKMLQLSVFAVVVVLFTNQTQGGAIGDFPIKTFPKGLSDVTRIFSEASEEIGKARSSLQAMIASLSKTASDPLEEQVRSWSEDTTGMKCQRYQLAFGGSVTMCVDFDFQDDFDDTTRVVIGDSVTRSDREGCAEGCAEVNEKPDGAVSSLDEKEFAAEEGSGQKQEFDAGPERAQKFEQIIENETLAGDTKTLIRGEEISEIQEAEKSAMVENLKKAKELGMKVTGEQGVANADEQGVANADEQGVANADEQGVANADEQGVANADERVTNFINSLTNKLQSLTTLLEKNNLKEQTRNKRDSLIKIPVPKIVITLSF